MNIFAVPPDQVSHAARLLHGLVERSFSRDPEAPSPEAMVADVRDGYAVMWVIADGYRPVAVSFTRVVTTPDGRRAVCVSNAGGSRVREWAGDLRSRLHLFKDAEGADLLMWVGRRGWARLFDLEPVRHMGNGFFYFEDYR